MRPEDYPAQVPLPEFAQPYAADVMRRREGLVVEDVIHGDDPYQSIGIHRPENPNGNVLAFIHGGGWTCGYKEWNDFAAPAFTAHGITFVSVGYRLAPGHFFPTGFNDCAAAVAWLYRNIADYGGDPGRLYLGGHSAGGHYASLLAVRDDWQSALDLPADVLRGCLPVSGVYHFGDGSGLSQRPRFLGNDDSGSEVEASPIAHISAPTPPFLMAHGDNDFPHLITQAEEMEEALRRAGTDVKRIVLPGRSHLEAHLATGESDGIWKEEVLNFLAA